MLFKFRHFFFIPLILIIGSCATDGRTDLNSKITSTDELFQLAQNVRFVGALPDGKLVDFSPSTFISNKGYGFTSMEQPNFIQSDSRIITSSVFSLSSGGELSLRNYDQNFAENYKFNYAFFIGIEDLVTNYLELELSDIEPSFFGTKIVYGLGSSDYSIIDIIENDVSESINYISIVVLPNGQSEGFFRSNNIFADFYEKLTFNAISISGEGDANVRESANSRGSFNANFDLFLRE